MIVSSKGPWVGDDDSDRSRMSRPLHRRDLTDECWRDRSHHLAAIHVTGDHHRLAQDCRCTSRQRTRGLRPPRLHSKPPSQYDKMRSATCKRRQRRRHSDVMVSPPDALSSRKDRPLNLNIPDPMFIGSFPVNLRIRRIFPNPKGLHPIPCNLKTMRWSSQQAEWQASVFSVFA